MADRRAAPRDDMLSRAGPHREAGPMGKKTRKAIKKLTEAVEDFRDQNEELSRKLTVALEAQSEEIHALTRTLGSHPGTPDNEAADTLADREELEEKPEEGPEATEAAERRAEELRVDLSRVEGTGAGERILVKDVEAAAEADG